MLRLPQAQVPARLHRGWRGAPVAGLAALLAACAGGFPGNDSLTTQAPPAAAPEAAAQNAIGAGQIKVGLLLPLTAAGNAGLAGQSMRNAAELALAEFNNPNIVPRLGDAPLRRDASRIPDSAASSDTIT